MRYIISLNHPVISWLMALSWLVLTVVVLLKPGYVTVRYDLTLSNFLSSFFSYTITRVDISEAIGHVFLFSILTVLWQRLLTLYFIRARALLIVISAAVVLAIATEIAQYFINRGSLLLDLMANLLGISIAYIGFSYVAKLKLR